MYIFAVYIPWKSPKKCLNKMYINPVIGPKKFDFSYFNSTSCKQNKSVLWLKDLALYWRGNNTKYYVLPVILVDYAIPVITFKTIEKIEI